MHCINFSTHTSHFVQCEHKILSERTARFFIDYIHNTKINYSSIFYEMDSACCKSMQGVYTVNLP